MMLREEPSDNRFSQGRRRFFLTLQSRSAPEARAFFQRSNPKKLRSARHNIPFWSAGNDLAASEISPPSQPHMRVTKNTCVRFFTNDPKQICGFTLPPRLAAGRTKAVSFDWLSVTFRV